MSGEPEENQKGGLREPRERKDVQEGVSAPEGGTFRFTVEERRRLADYIILLDHMDRAQRARREKEGVA